VNTRFIFNVRNTERLRYILFKYKIDVREVYDRYRDEGLGHIARIDLATENEIIQTLKDEGFVIEIRKSPKYVNEVYRSLVTVKDIDLTRYY
jgi:hypothetical protein